MRLTTKIYDSNGNLVNFYISKTRGATLVGMRTDVSLSINGVTVGVMKYSIQEDCLYIHRMDNLTVNLQARYRNVGKALFEYAFQKSIKAGKKGNIQLQATGDSPAAFFRMGLRKMSDESLLIATLLKEYDRTKSKEDKDKIMTSSSYAKLKQLAANRLKKDHQAVTFEEVILEGLYSEYNDIFSSQLANNKHINEVTCYKYNMHGIMYLPADIIELKKTEYQKFIPIVSSNFFSSINVDYKFNDERLKRLVQENKLDFSNAIEIDTKMDIKDPRVDILLSPFGLKMMKRNYISATFVRVYIHEVENLQAIVSSNGYNAFVKGFIKNVLHLLNLGIDMRSLLFSDKGYAALCEGTIKISETGTSLRNTEGKIVDYEALKTMLQERVAVSVLKK